MNCKHFSGHNCDYSARKKVKVSQWHTFAITMMYKLGDGISWCDYYALIYAMFRRTLVFQTSSHSPGNNISCLFLLNDFLSHFLWIQISVSFSYSNCSSLVSINKASCSNRSILFSDCVSWCDEYEHECSALTVTCVTWDQLPQPGWRLTLAAWKHLLSVYVLHISTCWPVCSDIKWTLPCLHHHHIIMLSIPCGCQLWKSNELKQAQRVLSQEDRHSEDWQGLWGSLLVWGNYLMSHMTSLCGPTPTSSLEDTERQ